MLKIYFSLCVLMLALRFPILSQQLAYSNENVIVRYNNTKADSLTIGIKTLSNDTDTTYVLYLKGSGIQFDSLSEKISITSGKNILLKSVFTLDTLASLTYEQDYLLSDLLGKGWPLIAAKQMKIIENLFVADTLTLHPVKSANKTDSSGYHLSGYFPFEELKWDHHLPKGEGIFVNKYESQLKPYSTNQKASFSQLGFSFNAADLAIKYLENGSFKITGASDFVVDDDTLQVNFGNAKKQLTGLSISQSKVDTLLLHVQDSFAVTDFKFKAKEAYISYNRADSSYRFFGDSIHVSVADTEILLGLGTENQPGGYLKNGSVDTLRFELMNAFELFHLPIKGDGLWFEYAADTFNIYGGADTIQFAHKNGADTIKQDVVVDFGSMKKPGIQFAQGALISLNLALTDTLTVDSLSFIFEKDHLRYSSADSSYAIYGGSLDLALKHDTLLVATGTASLPGVSIKRGVIHELSFQILGGSKIMSMQFAGSHTDTVAFFEYVADSSFFQIYGADTLVFNQVKNDSTIKHPIYVAMGSQADPGLIVDHGALRHAQLTVTDTIKIDGTRLLMDSVTFDYENMKDTAMISIYGGGLKLRLHDDEIHLSLKNKANPGIEIIDGELQQIHLGFFGGNKFLGMQLGKDSTKVLANCEWNRANETFELYGADDQNDTLIFVNKPDTSATTHDSTMHALIVGLGSKQHPGLLIRNDSLEQVNLTVSDTLTIDSVQLVLKDIAFDYDRDSSEFVLFGDELDLILKHDQVKVGLGDSLHPGIRIRHGALEDLHFDLLDSSNILGLLFRGSSLTFEYTKKSKEFVIYGGPDTLGFVQHVKEGKSDSTAINHYMYLSFGTDSFPGLKFKNGELIDVNLTVTDTLTIDSIALILDSITIDYDRKSKFFEMYGPEVGFAFKKDTLFLGFGDSINPGMQFGKKGLERLNFMLTDTLDLLGLKLYSDSVHFEYDSDSAYYKLFGAGLGVGFEHSSTDSTGKATKTDHNLIVNAGTDDNPGIVFENGALQHVNLGLSDTIQLMGVSLKLKKTFFEYDRQLDQFEIYGGPVDLLIKNDSIEADFGTSDDPGVVIKDGQLDSLNLNLTTGGEILGFELISKGVQLQWSRHLDQLEVGQGSLVLKYNQDSLKVDFSDQSTDGFIIKDGELTLFKGLISSAFSVSKLKLHTDSLLFEYDQKGDVFELHSGLALIKFDQDSLAANFGNDSLPGLVIDNGKVVSVDFVASAHESLLGLTVGIDSLGVVYDAASESLSMYDKEILVVVKSDSIEASLGNAAHPGLVFTNGQLQHYEIGVTSKFKLKSLEIDPYNLVFEYDFENKYFEMYDSIKVVIDSEVVHCDLGDSTDAGIIIQNGDLTQLNVDVSSDITLGGMELIVTKAGIRWPEKVSNTSSPLDKTELFGDFQVKELWSADVNLGNASQPGILITEENGHSSYEVENLDIKLGEVHVGFATIENMELKYDSTTLEVACTLIVSNDFEALGDIELVRASPTESWKLNNLGLGFEILPPNEGLPLGPVFLQGASAQVNNLSQGSDLQIEGSFQLSSGEPYYYDGNDGFLVFMDASGTYDPGLFDLDLNLLLGAYFDADGNPNWNSTIGDATLTADFDWNNNSYTLDGTLVVPTDYGVKVTSDIIINNNVTAFYGDVEVRIPESWDIIGGKVLGDIGGALFMDHNNSDDSYAAGWTTFSIGCVTCDHWWCDGYWRACLLDGTYGLMYNFGEESFSEIGQSNVNNIKKQFADNSRISGASSSSEHQTFEIMISDNEVGDKMIVKLFFDQEITADSLNLSIVGPHKMYEPMIVLYDSVTGYYPVESLDSVPAGTLFSELYFSLAESYHEGKYVSDFSTNTKSVPKLPELEKGMYEVVINTPATVTMQTVLSHSKTLIDVDVVYDKTSNMAQISTLSWIPQVNLQATYDSLSNTIIYSHKSTPFDSANITNEATIKIFVDTDTVGYDGRLIAQSHTLDSTFENGIQLHTTNWEVAGHAPDQPYYFYATITDKANAPVVSSYSSAVTVPNRITGQIVNADSSKNGVGGVVVFLDLNKNGKLDLNKVPVKDGEQLTSHAIEEEEPSCRTDADGNFYFDSYPYSGDVLKSGDYQLEYYLLRGYETSEGSSVQRGDLINYAGDPKHVIIEIQSK